MAKTELQPGIFHHLKKGVCERNHAFVPFPLSQNDFNTAVSHFFEFLTLPDNLKNQFQSNIIPEDEKSFVGYIKRKRQKQVDAATSEAFYDQKEYFHYNRYAETDFRDLIEAGDERVQTFFESARVVYERAEGIAAHIIGEFDEAFPGFKEKFMPEGINPHFYLRFLRYYTTGKGSFLAKGHYDQGGYTLALAESAPGLRIGKKQESLQEIVHTDGYAVFMPGLQLRLFTSDEFTPAWHDVVQRADDKPNKKTARWAVVFFVDPIHKIKTRWEDRHRPL